MVRKFSLIITAAFAFVATAQMATATPAEPKAKNCRMEQQCKWVNFKKICTWVKVCR